MKKIDQLTFTRFLAALMVVFFHGAGGAYFRVLNVFPLGEIVSSAFIAVPYFYVLSGFVMSLAHYRPGESFSLEAYWKTRLTRLYPLYLAAFLFACFYYRIGPVNARLSEALAHVLMLQAWNPKYALSYNFPAWSVSVEILFYALFPAFAWWAARRSTRGLIWSSLAVWFAVQIVQHILWVGYYPAWSKFLMYFPPFHLGSFALGAAAGVWFLREGRGRSDDSRVTLPLLLLGFFLASFYVIVSNRVSFMPREGRLMTGLLSPFLTLTLLSLALDSSRLSAFFKNPILMTLGEISYAVYIFHIPFRWIYLRWLESLPLADPRLVFDFTYLPLLLAFSFLAAFYFDRPLRVWLKNIFQDARLPLLALDWAILSFSVYLSFDFRFDSMRIRDAHYTTYRLMFWCAFWLRPVFSIVFRNFTLSAAPRSLLTFVQPVFLAVTASSAAMTIVLYAGYAAGWVKYFPLSALALDWVVTFALSLLVRYFFSLTPFSRKTA